MTRKIIGGGSGDPGDSTHYGTDDLGKINQYLTGTDQTSTDPVTIATRTAFSSPYSEPISILGTVAGPVGMEFGSNNATGGSTFMDWHVSSTDGDYSLRLVRNSGVNGTFDIINTGVGGIKYLTNNNTGLDTSTAGLTNEAFQFNLTISATPTTNAPDYATIRQTTNYNATQLIDPYDLATLGTTSNLIYGTNTIAPMGTAQNCTFTSVIAGSASPNNEIGNIMGWMRADNGASTSMWFTDYSVHGPIGVQPGGLQGFSMFMNNYYNGIPLRAPSTMLTLITRPGSGGGSTSTTQAATTFPIDYGINISGVAGTIASQTLGITTGIQVGVSSSLWANGGHAIIGTGMAINDITVAGLAIGEPSTTAGANTANAITVINSTTSYKIGLDLSGGKFDTTAIKLADAQAITAASNKITFVGGNTIDVQAIGTNQFIMLRFLPTHATPPTSATTSIFRLKNSTDQTNEEYLQFQAFGTGGYFIAAAASGTGVVRDLNIKANGNPAITFRGTTNTMAIAEGYNFSLGTTTGTMIGTATNQKLGFYNKTPVVRAAAIASPTSDTVGTKAAIDAIRVALTNLGLTA